MLVLLMLYLYTYEIPKTSKKNGEDNFDGEKA